MSKQHGNLPVPDRPVANTRRRHTGTFKLWYRVTYPVVPSGKIHRYTLKMGPFHSADERQRVMDKIERQITGYNWVSKHKIEFFFEKPSWM
jgi:hypothetical protein